MTASVWNPEDAVSANLSVRSESFTATAAQTDFTLTEFAYAVGTNALSIYIEGLKQRLSLDFIELTTTTFRILTALPAGTVVYAEGLVEISSTSVTDPGAARKGANNDITSLSGLTTPLNNAQGGIGDTGNPGQMAATLAALGGVDKTLVDTKGDLLVATAADTIAKKAAGTDGYQLIAQPGTSDGLQYIPNQYGYSLLNGYVDWSVSGNVLTAAIKTWAGADPSSTDPVYVAFRNVTITNGALVIRKLTAATAISINDTATLGTANNTAFRLWAVLFDDGGTIRMGVINCLSGVNIYPLAGWGIASSTLEDNASDSAHVFYTSGAAVASKAYSVIGYATWEAGLATAGTWSAAPSRQQLYGIGVPLPGQVIQRQRFDTGAVATGVTTVPYDDTIPQSGEGNLFISQAITPTSAANILDVEHNGIYSQSGAVVFTIAFLLRDAAADALKVALALSNSGTEQCEIYIHHMLLAGSTAATTFKVNAGPNSASTTTFNGQTAARKFGGVSNSYLSATEIMA